MKKAACLSALLLAIWVIASPMGWSEPPKKNFFEIKNGVNISHWLSQTEQRGEGRKAYFTRADVEYIASLGYDHIRLPVDEDHLFTEDGEKEPEAFALLHDALGWCDEFHLRVVVDLHILRSHSFDAEKRPLFIDPKAQERFYECWRKISGELNKYSLDKVAYELLNEPVADKHEDWNIIANRCLEAIRELEPERTIVLGSNSWQSYATVRSLRVPENDPNIILSFHYYEPFLLTHYKAPWSHMKDINVPVHYPGQVIADADLAAAGEFAKDGQKVHNIEVIEKHFKQVVAVAEPAGQDHAVAALQIPVPVPEVGELRPLLLQPCS